MARKLGDNQRRILAALGREYHTHRGSWYPGCGWIWNNQSGTIRLLNSLIPHGLVIRETERLRRWLLTPAGWQWLIDQTWADMKKVPAESTHHTRLAQHIAYLQNQLAQAEGTEQDG